VFISGALLWIASTIALAVTDDNILLPSVVLIGSFLVPVTVVFWFLDRDFQTELSVRRLAFAFFMAGVLGLLLAAILEVWLVPHRVLTNIWVGLVEEALKGAGVIALSARLRRYTVRDGVLLGVVVGLGFGAFESSGYTLTYGWDGSEFSLGDMISEELLRAAIAPFCHGLWTAIFGAAWFGARGRPSLRALGAYLLAAGLHALWNSASTAGIVVTVLFHGDKMQKSSLAELILPAASTVDPQWLYGAVQWAVMVAVALTGVLLVRRRWRSSITLPG
jgi:RsiW-degrading membrane proteinase PrsW (M82 family)